MKKSKRATNYDVPAPPKGIREIYVPTKIIADFTGTVRERRAHADHLIGQINLVLQENAERVNSAQITRVPRPITIVHREA